MNQVCYRRFKFKTHKHCNQHLIGNYLEKILKMPSIKGWAERSKALLLEMGKAQVHRVGLHNSLIKFR